MVYSKFIETYYFGFTYNYIYLHGFTRNNGRPNSCFRMKYNLNCSVFCSVLFLIYVWAKHKLSRRLRFFSKVLLLKKT